MQEPFEPCAGDLSKQLSTAAMIYVGHLSFKFSRSAKVLLVTIQNPSGRALPSDDTVAISPTAKDIFLETKHGKLYSPCNAN